MSYTKRFMEENPGKNFDGSDIVPDEVLSVPNLITNPVQFKVVVKEGILEGRWNPLDFYRMAKIAVEVFDDLKKDNDILSCAFDEIDKHPKGKAEVNGAIVEASSRATPDYKSCNDSVWNELKEKLSAREKYLKALPPQGAVDPDTGELVMPPKTTTSNFITVKL